MTYAHTPQQTYPHIIISQHISYYFCFIYTWNILVYASARCKMKSRLQRTVPSQHLKQAHVFLYYTALTVYSAGVVQIGIVKLFL